MAVRPGEAEVTMLDYSGALILKKLAHLLGVQRWHMQHWGVAMGSTTRNRMPQCIQHWIKRKALFSSIFFNHDNALSRCWPLNSR
ncbi:hypothetical protein BUE64_11560 [Corynebacterium diphtheriae subsp. lausannense]|nr:hypothetical protein BUE64_11560 [Corynebacterium diphtheriae subsp. lausannense]QBZ30484.1 hypothetical protein E4653_12400 [Corynebacterium diphtheriae subsp. lausannense]